MKCRSVVSQTRARGGGPSELKCEHRGPLRYMPAASMEVAELIAEPVYEASLDDLLVVPLLVRQGANRSVP